MGIAAYNRGNRSISESIYGRGTSVKVKNERPADWGSKTLAKATKKAIGCLAYMRGRGHELTESDLADMVQADERWSRETCIKAARAAMREKT